MAFQVIINMNKILEAPTDILDKPAYTFERNFEELEAGDLNDYARRYVWVQAVYFAICNKTGVK